MARRHPPPSRRDNALFRCHSYRLPSALETSSAWRSQTCQPRTNCTHNVLGQDLGLVHDERRQQWRGFSGVDLDTKPGAYRSVDTARRRHDIDAHGCASCPGSFASDDSPCRPSSSIRRPRRSRRLSSTARRSPTRTRSCLRASGRDVPAARRRQAEQQFRHAQLLQRPASLSTCRHRFHRRHRHADSRRQIRERWSLAAPLYFTGNTIVIDHGARLFSVFAHFPNSE